jgi:hypothetical protein
MSMQRAPSPAASHASATRAQGEQTSVASCGRWHAFATHKNGAGQGSTSQPPVPVPG